MAGFDIANGVFASLVGLFQGSTIQVDTSVMTSNID